MKVAVTGASGFLGSHLVRRLQADGHRVRAHVRDATRARLVPGSVEAIVEGDIASRPMLDQLVAGCDAVINTVSNFRSVRGSDASFRRINIEGAVEALAASRAAGVRRFVHCSTIGVHGDVRDTPATEDAPYAPGDLYQETKMHAEMRLRAAMAEVVEPGGSAGTEIVIVRPCSLYGPGDLRMLKMFRMLRRGRFVMIGPCRENFHAGYIDDVVDGFVRAMTVPGIHGEIFFIGGARYLPLADYLATAARAVDASPPRVRLPYAPVNALAALCEWACRPFGIEPPLHRRRVRFFRNNRAFSIDKARRLLGYAPQVDLEEGMARTVAWYRDQGLL
jgi:dihydroflavonol-4-reductase